MTKRKAMYRPVSLSNCGTRLPSTTLSRGIVLCRRAANVYSCGRIDIPFVSCAIARFECFGS